MQPELRLNPLDDEGI